MNIAELQFIPLFKDLDEREGRALEGVMSEQALRADEVLFEMGEKAWACFIVVEGSIKVELPPASPKGSATLLAELGPGQILGEICLVDGGRRSARCVGGAKGARLVKLARPEFDQVFNSGNRLAYRLMDLIAVQLVGRLRETTKMLRETIDK